MPDARIELHGLTSGLLDTLTAESLPRLRDALIDKLESGHWHLHDGDTLKVIAMQSRFVIVTEDSAARLGEGMLKAYRHGYNCSNGNWTWLRRTPRGAYEPRDGDPAPATWKTAAGAEKAMAGMMKTPKRVVVEIGWED